MHKFRVGDRVDISEKYWYRYRKYSGIVVKLIPPISAPHALNGDVSYLVLLDNCSSPCRMYGYELVLDDYSEFLAKIADRLR